MPAIQLFQRNPTVVVPPEMFWQIRFPRVLEVFRSGRLFPGSLKKKQTWDLKVKVSSQAYRSQVRSVSKQTNPQIWQTMYFISRSISITTNSMFQVSTSKNYLAAKTISKKIERWCSISLENPTQNIVQSIFNNCSTKRSTPRGKKKIQKPKET